MELVLLEGFKLLNVNFPEPNVREEARGVGKGQENEQVSSTVTLILMFWNLFYLSKIQLCISV